MNPDLTVGENYVADKINMKQKLKMSIQNMIKSINIVNK